MKFQPFQNSMFYKPFIHQFRLPKLGNDKKLIAWLNQSNRYKQIRRIYVLFQTKQSKDR
jgi:hypothetical protein